jgi:hypothetical protein
MKTYPVSDEIVRWVESLVGVATKIETEYGGVSEMLERPDWDASKTGYVRDLLNRLYTRLGEIKGEIDDHVSQKPF